MGEQGVRRVVAALRRHSQQTFDTVGPVSAVGAVQAHLDQMQGRQQSPGLPCRLTRRLGDQESNDRFHLGQPVAHRRLHTARTAQPILKLRPTARRRSHLSQRLELLGGNTGGHHGQGELPTAAVHQPSPGARDVQEVADKLDGVRLARHQSRLPAHPDGHRNFRFVGRRLDNNDVVHAADGARLEANPDWRHGIPQTGHRCSGRARTCLVLPR
jgi:hypothetical protein